MTDKKNIIITLKNKDLLSTNQSKKLELVIKKKIQLKENIIDNDRLKPPKIFGFKYF
jgi:hypothetical protein